MDPTTTALGVAAAVGGFYVAYRLKPPIQLPSHKPSFAWLPRYQFDVDASDWPKGDEVLPYLRTRFEELGFRQSSETTTMVRFTRGSALGDFSVKIMKLDVDVTLPIETRATLAVHYGALAAFDTGDLWTFASELKAKLGLAPLGLATSDEDKGGLGTPT